MQRLSYGKLSSVRGEKILGRHSHESDNEGMEADGELMTTITAQLTSYLVRPRQCQPAGEEKRQF